MFNFGSHDCVVGMVNGLQAGCTENHDSFPGRRKYSYFLEKYPGQLWGSTEPCIQWKPQALSPEVIMRGHEVDPSPPLLIWLRMCGTLLHFLIYLNGMHIDNFTFRFLLLLFNVDVLQCVWTVI